MSRPPALKFRCRASTYCKGVLLADAGLGSREFLSFTNIFTNVAALSAGHGCLTPLPLAAADSPLPFAIEVTAGFLA